MHNLLVILSILIVLYTYLKIRMYIDEVNSNEAYNKHMAEMRNHYNSLK